MADCPAAHDVSVMSLNVYCGRVGEGAVLSGVECSKHRKGLLANDGKSCEKGTYENRITEFVRADCEKKEEGGEVAKKN